MSDEETFMGDSSPEEGVADDKVFDMAALQEYIQENIQDIKEPMEVSEGVARILLQKYKWNKDVLLDKFYETDRNTFLINSNIIIPNLAGSPREQGECKICCNEDKLIGLVCNHKACQTCWQSYLAERISEGQSVIECMEPRCKLIIDDEKVKEFIENDRVLASFERVLIDNCVQKNILLRWCPGVDCGKVIKATHCEPHVVLCTCGCQFCFSCGNDAHEPVNCRLLKLWLKKSLDDSETSNWIDANTKDCPKCSVRIEKNGGCNYIRCENSSCQHEFCWICMNPWAMHENAWYRCNSFVQTAETTAADDDREAAQTKLKRYLFYFDRYHGHQQSLKLEEKLHAAVGIKMKQMQNAGMIWNDAQILVKAIEALSICRRSLMYTYVFAFYLKRDNNVIIFETNQKDLEMSTEELSRFLEQDLGEAELETLMQKVQDKCRYIEQRRKKLLDHCTEGTDNNTWVYTD